MTWEYKTVRLAIVAKALATGRWGRIACRGLHDDSESEINEFGADGWELVSVLPTEEPSFLGCSPGTKVAIAFFKRQKTG
jgi:hypothetical protein